MNSTKSYTAFLIMIFTNWAHAEATHIVDVRRNIALSEDDKVFKDYYVAGGTSQGFKKGQVIVASRKINVRDASGSTAVGEIVVPVGELRIIAVYEKVTVARETKLYDRQELPMLEQRGIMTGDLIEPKK